jgi:hypothetical protein
MAVLAWASWTDPILLNFNLNFWCLTLLSSIFQLYHGGQLYWWRKPEDAEKSTCRKSLTNFITHYYISHTFLNIKSICVFIILNNYAIQNSKLGPFLMDFQSTLLMLSKTNTFSCVHLKKNIFFKNSNMWLKCYSPAGE